ncbi:hypothetical protein ACFSKU_00650 [Pontibacter silvestris]|uniref:Uncharacterized protein n=1 Tax=Pontibacter silvestris TaxID=2305183 RepID=A0ABW4WTX5_9BACT|nr:hypothetical protein [Pontibacter silvestris]MCC9138128.1 hypothetical protein [Pontibacter silvestris]
MNRYAFWILMILPWFWLALFLLQSREMKNIALILLALILHLSIVINIRRKTVGLSVSETFKAFVPFWGWKEYKRLYFH